MKKQRRQQARSKATRAALITAARRLWEARGFDEVPVSQICASAKVATGTYYIYFKRKEHLLIMMVFLHILPRDSEIEELLESDLSTLIICQQMTGLMAARLHGLAKHLVRRAIEESFRFYREMEANYPGEVRSMRAPFHPVLLRGRTRKEVMEGWDLDVASTTIGWSMLQGMLFWASDTVADTDLESHLRQRIEMIINGIASARKTT